jgi:WD40 repeat protein
MYDLTSGDRELRPVERSNHNEAVSRIAFNLAGDKLVTADYGGTINTWSMRQDGPEESPTRSISLGSNVTALALAPTTPYLAAAGADNRVTLWAMNGNTAEHVAAQHDKTVLSLTFSNGGEYLVSTSDDARALLRKVDKGRTEPPAERSAIPHDQRVRAAAFSPDKRWLATGSDDGAIVLTDLERGTERKVLRGHEAAIVGLSFESGSEVLVSASLDKTARLWLVSEVDRGGETRPIALSGHSGPIGALRLDGAGRLVVTAGADGSIRVWPLKHELLIRLACRAVGRDFRDDEWAMLYPSEPIEPLCQK